MSGVNESHDFLSGYTPSERLNFSSSGIGELKESSESVDFMKDYLPTNERNKRLVLGVGGEPNRDIADRITGRDMTTPDIEGLNEVLFAPELLDVTDEKVLNSIVGLLVSGDSSGAAKIINKQIPSSKRRRDSKGNYIVDLPSGSYTINSPGVTLTDFGRIGASLLTFYPAAKLGAVLNKFLSAGGAALGGSVLEASTQYAIEKEEERLGGEKVRGENVVLAGAIPLIGHYGAKTLGFGESAYKGRLSDSDKALISASREHNVKVLTSDLFPPTTKAGETARSVSENIGTGGLRSEQLVSRKALVEKLRGETPEANPRSIYEDALSLSEAERSVAQNRLADVVVDMSSLGSVPMRHTIEGTNSLFRDSVGATDLPDLPGARRAVDLVTNFYNSRSSEPGGVSFDRLRKLRTRVREVMDSTDGTGAPVFTHEDRSAVGRIYEGLTADLNEFVSRNTDPGTFDMYREADSIYRMKNQELAETKLGSVLRKGEFVPEKVNTLLYSKDRSEVELLFNNLTDEGRVYGAQAIVSKALKEAEDELTGEIKPSKFVTKMRKTEENFNIMTRNAPEYRTYIDGIKNTLAFTGRAEDSLKRGTIGTTSAIYGVASIFRAGTKSVPGLLAILATVATAGKAAKIYESPAVKKFLLKASKTDPTSLAFTRLAKESAPEVRHAIQSYIQASGDNEQ